MSNLYILACKELNGSIYITRLPKAIISGTSVSPGIPDNWYLVGPGTNPSITEYSGTKFALMFTYLSHLFVRIVDIATWPPTSVNPVLVSGGPNPPTAFEYTFELSQDSLTFKTESSVSFGLVQEFFKPPLITNPLLFLDPTTSTYSVTIVPQAGWAPDPPVGVSVYYRFYARPYPYNGPWVLTTDWTLTTNSFPWFSFPFSSVGNLRYEFSVTWGTQFNFTDQWNPNAHAEGIPGQYFVTVDSTTQAANAQVLQNEFLTFDMTSSEAFGVFGPRLAFIVESATDSIGFPTSLVGSGESFGFFDSRQAFINEAVSDSVDYSISSAQGFTLQAVMG